MSLPLETPFPKTLSLLFATRPTTQFSHVHQSPVLLQRTSAGFSAIRPRPSSRPHGPCGASLTGRPSVVLLQEQRSGGGGSGSGTRCDPTQQSPWSKSAALVYSPQSFALACQPDQYFHSLIGDAFRNPRLCVIPEMSHERLTYLFWIDLV